MKIKSILAICFCTLPLFSCSEQESPDVLDPKEVDLGLSVNWAAYNLGADSSEEYGQYFAWAEVSEKSKYSWENYKYSRNSTSVFNLDLTKYTTTSAFLEKSDDAANDIWGNGWRIPTTAEFQELIDKCEWTLATIGGNKGYNVKGPNGNSIFLPFAGIKDGNKLAETGTLGFYWTSQTYQYYEGHAEELDISKNYHTVGNLDRYMGLSIRPVK